MATVFGEIVWLLTRSPHFRELRLFDLERLVMPAIILRQFSIQYAGDQPTAVELFAMPSQERFALLSAQSAEELPLVIEATEWTGGSNKLTVLHVSLLSDELYRRDNRNDE